MKTYIILFAFFAILSLGSYKNIKYDHFKNEYHIESVTLNEKQFKQNCFIRHKSFYPLLKGKENWDSTNHQIKKIIEDFIEESRLSTECIKEKDAPQYMGWANTDFEILSQNNEILSIELKLTNGFGGGNMWTPMVKVINIDPKNRKIIPKKELHQSNIDLNNINSIIFKYFYNLYPEDAEESIGKNYLKSNKELNELEFGLRNDSLLILFPAYPSAHFSYAIYSIPVKSLK